jgi:S-(hydroxymethyl)glutathione dehydrogenase/alcohol dehydrogenase
VYGLGGVGLSVLQAARIAGADPLIAVDAAPGKEMLARVQGATDFLQAGPDTPRRVRALTGGLGTDHAFECVGRSETIRQAWSSTRRGGQVTVLGIGGTDDKVSFSALEVFHFARTLRGCVFGSCDPARDVPVLAEHMRARRLRIDDLITDRISLSDIPEAFARMAAGSGGRSLVVF